jgi:hypothetical protein
MENKDLIESIKSKIAANDAEAAEKNKPLYAALQSLGYVVKEEKKPVIDPKAYLTDPEFIKFRKSLDKDVIEFYSSRKGGHDMQAVRKDLFTKYDIEKYGREVSIALTNSLVKLWQHGNLKRTENKGARGGNSGESKYYYELRKKELQKLKPGPKARKTKR